MPSKELIRRQLKQLEPIPLMTIAPDGKIWEGEQYGATFKVTKEILPLAGKPMFYGLTIMGSRSGIDKIANDFRQELGTPADESWVPEFPGMYSMVWLAE